MAQTRHDYCALCDQRLPQSELVPADSIRPHLAVHIAREADSWSHESFICREDLRRVRWQHVEALIEEDAEEVDRLNDSIEQRLREGVGHSLNVEANAADGRTVGERTADAMARFGGSWRYIILFATFIVAWMALNGALLAMATFDPYPYIFLNLVLSCLAAVQAPVIMISQNRQEARDRERARNEYIVNLKAELEIRLLHEKIDHLLRHQTKCWSEIQRAQLESVRDLDLRLVHPPTHA